MTGKTFEELKQPPEGFGDEPMPEPAESGSADAPALPEPLTDEQKQAIEEGVIEALKTVYDPEIPVNIYDLGLIYRVVVRDDGKVQVDMTLTAPGCPVAQTFPAMVENEISRVEGVRSAHVEVVWDPPWNQDMMSEAAKLQLNLI